jgi:GNAT superfamily N-acetyltransferase
MMISAPSPGETHDLVVCPALGDEVMNELFAASWPGHTSLPFARMLAHSLCWVGAYREERLVGFVNVATDGGIHAFVVDTTVHPGERRQGLGVRLVRLAAEEARSRGARWLHVDYEPYLEGFYVRCGFRATAAGVMRL